MTQLCHHSLLEQASLQQRLWLRHSRTQFDTGLDLNLLSEIADYFRPIERGTLASGLMNPKVLGVNINTLRYQVPGGMLSNLISQLKEQGKEDKYEEVLAEVYLVCVKTSVSHHL